MKQLLRRYPTNINTTTTTTTTTNNNNNNNSKSTMNDLQYKSQKRSACTTNLS